MYPNDKDGCLNCLGGTSLLLLLIKHAAVVVDGCSESPRLGEDILVRLYHLISEISLVFHQALMNET